MCCFKLRSLQSGSPLALELHHTSSELPFVWFPLSSCNWADCLALASLILWHFASYGLSLARLTLVINKKTITRRWIAFQESTCYRHLIVRLPGPMPEYELRAEMNERKKRISTWVFSARGTNAPGRQSRSGGTANCKSVKAPIFASVTIY